MYERLTAAEPLSEVRFVHDYVQLVLWPHTLSLYPKLRMSVGDHTLRSTDQGFYDSICRLIGQRIEKVGREEKVQLSFQFTGGTKLLVSLRPEDAVCEEVAMLSDDKGGLLVERYDD
ncbi:MAG TPA: hypothetical protein VF523_06245 [Burkholderiales bacterium]